MASSTFIALLSAACFGGAAVLVKKGLAHSTPQAALLIVAIINAIIFWTAALLFAPMDLFLTEAVIFFLIGGVLANGVARTLQFTGIDKVGPSRNHTVMGSISLFAALFAIIILEEKLTLALFIGTALIVSGILLLAGEPRKKTWKKRHLIYPLIASAFYGLAASVQKMGLDIVPHVLIATAAASIGALTSIILYQASSRKSLKVGGAFPFFIAAGIANSVALLLNYNALNSGNVTVIMPLIGTQPLFATLFSLMFLRGTEKVTLRSVGGAAIVVIGVSIITGS